MARGERRGRLTWLTREEAAARVGGHTAKVRRWIRSGELVSHAGWIGREDAAERWIDDRPESAADSMLRGRPAPLIDERELLAVDSLMRSRRGRPSKAPRIAAVHGDASRRPGERVAEVLDDASLAPARPASPGFLPPAEIRARLVLVSVAAESLIDRHTTVLREAPTELARLTTALFAERAKCAGDPRYTADTLTAEDLDEMTEICGTCRVRAACDSYATAADPSAGYWAGTEYPIAALEAVA